MDRSKALAALSALAHETRLDLIRLLVPQGAEGLAAGRSRKNWAVGPGCRSTCRRWSRQGF
jgi:hypothetical protein